MLKIYENWPVTVAGIFIKIIPNASFQKFWYCRFFNGHDLWIVLATEKLFQTCFYNNQLFQHDLKFSKILIFFFLQKLYLVYWSCLPFTHQVTYQKRPGKESFISSSSFSEISSRENACLLAKFLLLVMKLVDKSWKMFWTECPSTIWIIMVLKEVCLKELKKYGTYWLDLNYESCTKQCFSDFPKISFTISDKSFMYILLACQR